jgi:hypothetical protein
MGIFSKGAIMAIISEIRGGKLIITADLDESPSPSSSGKTLLAVTSGGFTRTDLKYQNKPLSISVMATIPNK